MLLAWHWDFTADDAYITLRYARHWVQGEGIVWNIGERPVEGYSNFIHLLLGVGAYLVGFDPVATVKLVNAVALVASLFFVYRLGRELGLARGVALVPPAAMCGYKGSIHWAVSGLETALFGATFLLAVLLFVRGCKMGPTAGWRSIIAAALSCVVCALCRPDGPLAFLSLASFGFVLVALGSERWSSFTAGLRLDWPWWLAFVAIFLVLYGPYFAWRWSYFGLPWPNSVYCKGDGGGNGIVVQAVALAWPLGVLALIRPLRAWTLPALYVLGVPLVTLLLYYDRSALVAGWNRHFLLGWAFIALAAAQALQALLTLLPSRRDALARMFGATALVAAVSALAVQYPTLEISRSRYLVRSEARKSVAEWAKTNLPRGTQLALGDVGVVGYYAEIPIYDLYCLNNREMVERDLRHSRTRHAAYIMDRRDIGAIAVTYRDAKLTKPRDWLTTALEEHPQFRSRYSPAAVFRSRGFHYQIFSLLARE